jgi:hypothetical protein
MPSSRILIASNTLSTSAATVTFSGIPATYTDLVLRISARSTAADTDVGYGVEFNGSATTVYSRTEVRGNGASAASGSGTGDAYIAAGRSIDGDTATASTFSSNEIYIPSYTASQNKPLSLTNVVEQNSTSNAYIVAIAGLWRDTSAITQIKLTPVTGSWKSDSSFYLYGIKNS